MKQAVPPSANAGPAPQVFFASKPSELLLFSGAPAYRRIPQTSLAYATNTDSDVFVHYPDRQIYVLLSGRWFRASTLEGPWNYAGNDLPEDFRWIPPTHSRSHVLASVPGAQAAHDALLLAQVPTTAIVDRSQTEASVKASFAGDPKFDRIEGTTLSYAVNTQEKVIKYGDLYYLCFPGVWFRSTAPQGPWKTADSVPAAIYEIPPTSPVYNVTYVTVSNRTETTVESSYSSGYEGVFVLGTAVGASVPTARPDARPGTTPRPERTVESPRCRRRTAGAPSLRLTTRGRKPTRRRRKPTTYAQWGSSVVKRGDYWVRPDISAPTTVRFSTTRLPAGAADRSFPAPGALGAW